MSAQATAKEPMELIEPRDDGCLELSDEQLLALIDRQAWESLQISGKEFLRRYCAHQPIVNDVGQPVPGWSALANLAWLLDE